MDPIALEFGYFTIRWYGIFAGLGFLSAFSLLVYRASLSDIVTSKQMADFAMWGIIGGLVGARILYVVENWSRFRETPFSIVRIDQGGLVFYGGLAFGAAVVVLACYVKRTSLPETADMFAPVIPLGLGFGRIGCFLNGCCFGKPWDGWLSVHYPAEAYPYIMNIQAEKGIISADSGIDLAQATAPVVPVQLLASAGGFLLCALLVICHRKFALRRGQLFLVFVIAYGVVRFLTEFLRGDYLEYVWGLTSAQWWCIIAVIAGSVLFWIRRSTSRVP